MRRSSVLKSSLFPRIDGSQEQEKLLDPGKERISLVYTFSTSSQLDVCTESPRGAFSAGVALIRKRQSLARMIPAVCIKIGSPRNGNIFARATDACEALQWKIHAPIAVGMAAVVGVAVIGQEERTIT